MDILLGADVIGHIYTNGFLAGDKNTPHAMNTQLGWIIFGAIQSIASMSYHTTTRLVNSLECTNGQLEMAVRRLWELQEPIEQPGQSTADADIERFYTSTLSRTAEGCYVVRIPLSDDPTSLGDSRAIALKQFYRMEGRMNRDGELRRKYTEFMQIYIDMGHMVEASNAPTPGRTYYIPHHAVIERFRVVFNASQRTTSGVSLNELQMVGPTLQATLFQILMRFRTYRIALAADVEKMFRQILVHPDDRDLQRIFWRQNQGSPVTEFQLTTATYGTASAPFLATRTLRQCAIDHRDEFPKATQHVLTHFYVDDYLGGADTEDDAIELMRSLDALLRKGGLVLRKWKSNSWNVLEECSDVAGNDLNIELREGADASVLGLKWNVSSDAFWFSVKADELSKVTTKVPN